MSQDAPNPPRPSSGDPGSPSVPLQGGASIRHTDERNAHDGEPRDGNGKVPAGGVHVVAIVLPPDQSFLEGLRITLASVDLLALELKDTRALIDSLRSRTIRAILFDPELDSARSGLKAVSAIRREWASVPIVIYSSQTEPHDRMRGLMSGADRYLARPASPLRIVSEFCHLLGIDPLRIQLGMAADTVVYDAALLEQTFGEYTRGPLDDQ